MQIEEPQWEIVVSFLLAYPLYFVEASEEEEEVEKEGEEEDKLINVICIQICTLVNNTCTGFKQVIHIRIKFHEVWCPKTNRSHKTPHQRNLSKIFTGFIAVQNRIVFIINNLSPF